MLKALVVLSLALSPTAAQTAGAQGAAAQSASAEPALREGPWRATLASPGGELPFGLRLQSSASAAAAATTAAAQAEAAKSRELATPPGRIGEKTERETAAHAEAVRAAAAGELARHATADSADATSAAGSATAGTAGATTDAGGATASTWHAWIVNGSEEIPIPQVSWNDGRLELSMPHYASRLVATPAADGASLDGEWLLDRGGTIARMPFHATAGVAPRFAVTADAPGAAGTPGAVAPHAGALTGTWAAQFADDEDPAVGLFKQAPDGTATGTFLTTTGDYRFLAGDARAAADAPLGSGLRLSCFDGAHAFLFVAAVQADGTLAGDFWSRDASHAAWTARRDEHAALPDAFDQVHWKEGARLDDVAFPDLDGVKRSLADPAFAGKCRIVQIFGSWCPNCADEAVYLAELQRIYGKLGLSIVGIAFERTGEFEKDVVQVRRFAQARGVTWPLLVAGLANKEKATATLGLLDRIKGFPTTIFLHQDGRVAAVHSGFCGPATGDAWIAQKQEFAELVETLLTGK